MTAADRISGDDMKRAAKAMARRLAESGATHLEGRAVTGRKSDAMFSHYAASANREALAGSALGKVAGRIGKVEK